MLKLSKYELRKNRNTLLLLLGGLALLQILFLLSLSSKKDSYIMSSVGTLTLYGIICYFSIFLFAVTNYYREINSRTSYLVFMTPVSSLRIILSKMLTVLFLGAITGSILAAVCIWDVQLLTSFYSDYAEMTDIINQVLQQFGIHAGEIAVNLLFSLFIFLLSFFSTVSLIYFCITLSATLLQNSRFKLICSILFFLIGNFAKSKLQDLISDLTRMHPEEISDIGDFLVQALPYSLLNLAVLLICIGATSRMLSKKLSL